MSTRITNAVPAAIEDKKKETGITRDHHCGGTLSGMSRNSEPSELWRIVERVTAAMAHSWRAKDGASLYKTKCAGCHGAKGKGKAAVKSPALKGTSLTADALAEHITKGEATSKAPHNKGIVGVTDAEAKSIAEFIKTLK